MKVVRANDTTGCERLDQRVNEFGVGKNVYSMFASTRTNTTPQGRATERNASLEGSQLDLANKNLLGPEGYMTSQKTYPKCSPLTPSPAKGSIRVTFWKGHNRYRKPLVS